MLRDDLIATVANPRAWWNGNEGLEEVVWLVLTELRHALLATATVDQMYAFRRRDIDAE